MAQSKQRKPLPKGLFDIKKSRAKHEVLNRKVRGNVGSIAAARANAIKRRKDTLLPEYRERNKAKHGGFVDKRLGARDGETLDPEAYANEKFLRAQNAKNSGRGLAVEEGEGTESTLTHGGKDLSQIDFSADAAMFQDDHDDDDGAREAALMDQVLTGDSDVQSTLDAIQQARLEKKLERERTEEKAGEIDKDFDAIRNLLQFRVNEADEVKKKIEDVGANNDEYDMDVRSLRFEPRGRPTDRTKSTEEIEKEKLEHLKELEDARLARATAADRSPEHEENHLQRTRKRVGGATTAYQGGDDLDDVDMVAAESVKQQDEIWYDDDGVLHLKSDEIRNEEVVDELEDEDDLVEIDIPDQAELDMELFSTLAGLSAEKGADNSIDTKYRSRRQKAEAFINAMLTFGDYCLAVEDESIPSAVPVNMRVLAQVVKPSTRHAAVTHVIYDLQGLFTIFQTSDDGFVDGLAKVFVKFGAYLHLFQILFSTTDKYHPILEIVINCACLLLHSLQAKQQRIVPKITFSALFMCDGVIACCRESGKIVPDVLQYLYHTLVAAIEESEENSVKRPGKHATFGLREVMHGKSTITVRDVLSQTLRCTSSYVSSLQSVGSCAYEVAVPFKRALNENTARLELSKTDEERARTLTASKPPTRVPMKFRRKVKALHQLTPLIEHDVSVGVRKEKDRFKNEEIKLHRQMRKEMRGVQRELRRDAKFLSQQRLKEQLANDDGRKAKTRQLKSYIESDRREGKKVRAKR
eukprot:Clim_evm224s157 gene=Clim_evmTU224s157